MKLAPNLGYYGRSALGVDIISLDGQGTIENQTVGVFVSFDSYLGLLALSPRVCNPKSRFSQCDGKFKSLIRFETRAQGIFSARLTISTLPSPTS